MDSKQKFLKNRYWKKKYQPRNGATANVSRLSKSKSQDVSHSEEKSEDNFTLKQPVPKDGWFPESDSEESSDLEDYSSLSKITGQIKQCDKNWFDKELDNVQIASEVHINTKNIKDNETTLKSIPKSKISSSILKKILNDEKSDYNAENEEKELDFLLSLKEPVYNPPVLDKNDFENKRTVAYSNINDVGQNKPVKTIDLEKWLDSVLDD